jgi:penicillin-binding protein 2
MKSFGQRVRAGIAALLVVAGVASCTVKLMQIQLSESNEYIEQSAVQSVYTQTISSSRGEIVDSEGNTIVGNKAGYNVIIQPDTFPSDNAEGNEVILNIINLLKENNIDWEETLPISETTPYKFTVSDDDTIKNVKSKLNLNVYATADDCIYRLLDEYDISDEYTQEEQRLIAGVRYEMLIRDFSMSTEFTIAEDIDKSLVSYIEEMSIKYPGIDIVESPIREIEDGNIIPHEIGTVGPIYAEEYDDLKDQGYSLDDVVGKSGIEKAMESELRGTDGEKKIIVENGEVVSSEVTEAAENGHTVKLTVNGEFQKGLQDILGNFINNFYDDELGTISCGAIAVVDCENGAVLGLATNPTYDLVDYKEDYQSVLNADNTPLVNRAKSGLYRPGSTFKVITATAGLNEGYVDANSTFNCTKKYEYMDTTYNCTGLHGNISVARALMVSCNIYFYHLSELLTIDKISDYAKQFGLAQNTGIETSDVTGRIGDQETYAALGQTWTIGQVLQTGIGNSETAVTPLQMACVAMTIANKGVRYQPYLVDSVWDYDMENCIYKTEKTVAQTITTKVDNTWDIVTQGMILASSNNIPAEYSLTNLGYDVAIKTGTPQLDARTQDSLFIGFAPADDPKIAFCGVLEGGEYSKYMIRSILRLYESIYGKFDGSVDDPETTSATETDENGSIVTTITSSTSSTANNVENPLADEPVANDMAQDPVADDDDNEGNPDA